MKRDVYLNKSAVLTGLGDLNETWQGLLDGRSAVVKKSHFANDLLVQTGLSLNNREFDEVRHDYLLELIHQCLQGIGPLPEDTFVIWAGSKSSAEMIENEAADLPIPQCCSPEDCRRAVAEYFGLSGAGMEVNAACASSAVATALGMQFIADGKYDHVLVVAADVIGKFVYYGFAAIKAMTDEICHPFDVERRGLSLGDGAAALFLSAERESDIRVSGYGISNDANHITGPSRDGSGLAQAMRGAIEMAGLQPEQIEAFCAHATGTKYNDSMELLAERSVFTKKPIKVFGIKGAIGHTLGASGAIEIALCAKCLESGMLPATIACNVPEAEEVLLRNTPFPGNNIITSNSGFGGVNAVILLEKL